MLAKVRPFLLWLLSSSLVVLIFWILRGALSAVLVWMAATPAIVDPEVERQTGQFRFTAQFVYLAGVVLLGVGAVVGILLCESYYRRGNALGVLWARFWRVTRTQAVLALLGVALQYLPV